MMTLTTQKNKIVSALTAALLVCSFILAPVSDTISVNRAQAQEIVYDPTSYIPTYGTFVQTAMSAVANGIIKGLTDALVIKEITLDAIAWGLVNIVLKEMIRSTTKWVNSGFKGSPAFVTDLQGFLLDIGDKVAGNFIYGAGLSGLCSPFKLNIQLAIDIQYKEGRGGYRAQCRLSSVMKNIDGFLNGDFLQGGWDGWYNVAMVPSNNAYGAMLEAQTGLYAEVAGMQLIERDKLSFGSGFLSMEHCFSEGDDQRCSIETPGVVIQDQLNRALGFPGDRLVVADEINELVGALLSQVAKQALGGIGGLLGMTESRNGYGGNYFAQVTAEQTPINTSNAISSPFTREILTETKYRGFQTSIVNLILDAQAYKDRVYGGVDNAQDENTQSRCTTNGALTNSLQSQLRNAERAVASSTALITTLNTYVTDYALLTSTTTGATTTNALLSKYRASSVPDAQSRLMNDFLRYQTSGQIHGEELSVQLDMITLPALRTEIQTFTSSIDTACSRQNNGSDVTTYGGA